MVSWISDDNIDDLQKLDSLKNSVEEALSDVINLTSKLTNTKKNLPDKLPDNPMDLSFWIGAHLGGPVAEEQQRLLEEKELPLAKETKVIPLLRALPFKPH